MTTIRRFLALASAAAIVLSTVAAAEAESIGRHEVGTASSARMWTLNFDVLGNMSVPVGGDLPGVLGKYATGTMRITVVNGQTNVRFKLTGARPHEIYTIWTVFGVLDETQNFASVTNGAFPANICRPVSQTQCTVLPEGFYSEANLVSPLARLDSAFTNSMGLDPGATFITDANGDGKVEVNLDYDLMGDTEDGPPVANGDVIAQTVPTLGTTPACASCAPLQRKVTTTWLRKYIADVGADQSLCANYDSGFSGSLYWQCIDPASGLPRVWRFPWNHFRLAAHPDGLTHGFIGGNAGEHVIDMVGRRSQAIEIK